MKFLIVTDEQLVDLKGLIDMALKVSGLSVLAKSVELHNLLLSAREIPEQPEQPQQVPQEPEPV